ncbi:SDR family oxidoreductase [Metabacillus arenae]|uniref:Oxidoreductase n=1 Tax=Metabacillus arenae TaxID=2771434 RepID=A0A926NDW3_9BACI|nr:hypothetical protein [Metabacillus arenae]MBD1382462.1 hypothetical protein [Metabacillus arenae]
MILKNIRAITLMPGVMIGDWNKAKREAAASRNPLQRLATPKEVIDIVPFLWPDASSYVNEVNIDVHGGEPL